jgi:16S rRNA G1207 methylase RsmC
VVHLKLPDVELDLVADTGVFSNRRIDPGTEVLLRGAPEPPRRGDILDLGTGYGPVAVVLARRAPGATVWAVDVNERALELARMNAADHALDNVRVAAPDDVPEAVRFAAIYSNPPVKVGKAAMHDLLLRWLVRLEPDGRAYLVINRNLGSDSLVGWLAQQGFAATRLRSKRGYRVLEVAAR